MDKPVVLIHFLSLEQYPPVMNLIEFIARQGDRNLVVLTTAHRDKAVHSFSVESERIIIKRLSKSDKDASPLFRYYQYLKFYSLCALELIALKPRKILYYETLSSFPAFLYWKHVNSNVKIFIHYHEYTSPAEQLSGMRLSRYFHQKEKEMYPTVEWLSHTNPERLRLFLEDEGLQLSEKFFVMPNYPGRNWFRGKRVGNRNLPKEIVYVGAVSRETMYFEEFVKWVMAHKGQFTFDIYSNNISKEDRDWLLSLIGTNVRLHPSLAYSELPDLLSRYDIGVILYKGHIPNYVHNAPNKLFEYLACGLDVWVPSTMTGCIPYHTDGTFPIVIPVDFTKLYFFNWQEALEKKQISNSRKEYFYEDVYPNITARLFSS